MVQYLRIQTINAFYGQRNFSAAMSQSHNH
jgi:hypothetical protein